MWSSFDVGGSDTKNKQRYRQRKIWEPIVKMSVLPCLPWRGFDAHEGFEKKSHLVISLWRLDDSTNRSDTHTDLYTDWFNRKRSRRFKLDVAFETENIACPRKGCLPK